MIIGGTGHNKVHCEEVHVGRNDIKALKHKQARRSKHRSEKRDQLQDAEKCPTIFRPDSSGHRQDNLLIQRDFVHMTIHIHDIRY